MSEFYSYEERAAPKYCQKPLLHSLTFAHVGKQVRTDNNYYEYVSDRLRCLMHAHDIGGEYELDHFLRYEYCPAPGARWHTVFEAHSLFSAPSLELIKVYIYGHFDENNQFVPAKMRVIQGQEVDNLETLILKERLLPSDAR